MNIAAAYLDDETDAWIQGWSRSRTIWSWPECVTELCSWFEEKSKADVIEEFNKLRQKGTVEEYLIRFEELRALLTISQPMLDEAYFVSSFVSGLDDQLRLMVKMLQPTTVKQAAENAQLQEMALEAFARKQ